MNINRDDTDGYIKARKILTEAFPNRVDRLDPSKFPKDTADAIRAALSPEIGNERANDIAFHMSDWNSDAAFVLALHLFPEQFTKDEIEDGVRDFLIHAPNHIAEAAKLMGFPVESIFKRE